MKQLQLPNDYRNKLFPFLSTHQDLFVRGKERELAEAFREHLLPLNDLEALMSEQLRRSEEQQAWNAQSRLREYCVFWEPIPKGAESELLWSGPSGEEMRRKVTPNAITVYRKDWDKFCSERRLNPDKLMQLALGQVAEYKGWRRASLWCDPANPLCLGRAYVSPTPEKQTKLNPDSSYKPPVQWQPSYAKRPVTFSPTQALDGLISSQGNPQSLD